jgi:hypothetical protein
VASLIDDAKVLIYGFNVLIIKATERD